MTAAMNKWRPHRRQNGKVIGYTAKTADGYIAENVRGQRLNGIYEKKHDALIRIRRDASGELLPDGTPLRDVVKPMTLPR